MVGKIFEKLIAAVIFVLILFGIAEAQNSGNAYQIDTFTTSNSPAVNISTSGGSINVIGHSDSEVIVEMYARRGGRYLSPSDDDLSDFEIIIQKDGDTVIAEARRKRSGFFSGPRNISISFKVYTPEFAKVEGKTSGGSVSAERLYDGVKLSTSGGSVSLKEIEGVTDVSTSGGSISIEKVSGSVSARTSGGSISASDLYGEAELRTSGGSIRLENISAKISARTSGGSIRGSFTTFLEDIELQTSGGSIRVDVPERDHYNLELRGNRVDMHLRNFTGEVQRNYIKGIIGEGGPLLMARTSGGTVTVRS